MGWDDGAEDRGGGGGGDLNAASRQTDRPRIRFPFPPIGSRRERPMEREGDRDNLACCPLSRLESGGGGDGLFVRALWLNYDALLRIPRHAASRVRWMALFLEMVASLSAKRF